MTVSTSSSSAIFLGNGSVTSFSIPFIGVSASDIEVFYTDASGVLTNLTPSQYTLTLNAPATGALWGVGGTIVYPLSGPAIANGTSLTVTRIVPLTQLTTISNQGDFSPTVIETALDTLCFEIQQVAARTGQIRGEWVSGAQYNFGDVVQDGANGNSTGNYYLCAIANISTVWATDLAAGDWSLAINISAFTTVAGGTNGQIQYNNAGYLGGLNSTGTGNVVKDTSPTITSASLTSPSLTSAALGTPASGILTNCTGTAAGLTAGNVTTNANLTGGVTSVGNAATVFTNANLTGSIVTSVGNATTVNMAPIANSLSADVLLNNVSNFFDGPSVAQGTSGTWFASGTVTLIDGAGTASFQIKLWDGTTVIASSSVNPIGTNIVASVSLSGFKTSPAGNLRISVKDVSSTSGKILFNQTGTNKDSTITAIRIA